MQHVATRLALALTLALAAGAAHGAEPAAKAITLGQQVRGEITSSDVVNWRDGSRSELYAISLAADEGVRFEVRLANAEGLEYQAMAAAFEHDRTLALALFIATSEYYYPRDAARVDRMLGTLRWR